MKSSRRNCPALTEEDIKYLAENTRYDEKEIREWFRLDKIVYTPHIAIFIP